MSGNFLVLGASGNFFFVIGIVLVIAAVALAFIGIRAGDRFPPSRPVMLAIVAVFAVAVGTTMAFAIVKANDEQKGRNEKLAKEAGTTTSAATGPVTALSVSSPADGGLSYTPNGLTAQPGNVSITYTNPSPVPHSIAVATANGNIIQQVQPFTSGKQTVTLNDLKPGKYEFFCTVPGHRQAGMQGSLTVLAGAGSSSNNP
jgi:plastocyanin